MLAMQFRKIKNTSTLSTARHLHNFYLHWQIISFFKCKHEHQIRHIRKEHKINNKT